MSEKTGGGGSTLKVVLIVAGLVAALLAAICGVAAVLSAVAVLVPRIQTKQQQTMCAYHLRELGTVHFTTARRRADATPPYGGPALFVHYRQSDAIAPNAGPILLCPADPGAVDPAAPGLAARYAAADLTDVPPDLCSFAVYDYARFSIDTEQSEPLAACPHHRDGVNVLYFDGAVRFRDWIDLGLAHGTPVTFGPDSNVPEFRKLRYRE